MAESRLGLPEIAFDELGVDGESVLFGLDGCLVGESGINLNESGSDAIAIGFVVGVGPKGASEFGAGPNVVGSLAEKGNDFLR